MDADKHGLINHYEALVHEYRQDLERNVQLARNASGDPYGMLDRINKVLVAEIARLKVQLLDLDLRVAQGGRADASRFGPAIDGFWPSMPVYSAGDAIQLGAGLTTYGFHMTEANAGGYIHRWSGPSVRSGFVALIDRCEPLVAETIVECIDPRVSVEQVDVDGERVAHRWESPGKLRFLIPALPDNPVPAMTHVSLRVSQTFRIMDVKAGSQDARKVGFDVASFRLDRLAEDAEV